MKGSTICIIRSQEGVDDTSVYLPQNQMHSTFGSHDWSRRPMSSMTMVEGTPAICLVCLVDVIWTKELRC